MPLDDAVVPPDAHARVAAPLANDGATVLRRGYSFDNGHDVTAVLVTRRSARAGPRRRLGGVRCAGLRRHEPGG